MDAEGRAIFRVYAARADEVKVSVGFAYLVGGPRGGDLMSAYDGVFVERRR